MEWILTDSKFSLLKSFVNKVA